MDSFTEGLKNLSNINFKDFLIKELRVVEADNKDIPVHTLRVKFKRLLGAHENKYYVTFSIEINEYFF